jgi:hypothetical protein
MFHGHLDYFQNHLFGGTFNKKLGDHDIPNAHNRWCILFHYVWEPAWIKMNWNSIWLRAQSHMTSHYIWESVTTLHDFGGVLGWPLDTFFWALTISWSQLLARVWSGPSFKTLFMFACGASILHRLKTKYPNLEDILSIKFQRLDNLAWRYIT